MSAPLTTKEDWINAAYEEVARSGLNGLTIEGIATRLSVSRIGFYQRFKDRQELYDALIERWVQVVDELFQKAQHTEDPIEQLRQVGYDVLVDPQQRAMDRALLLTPSKSPELVERMKEARQQSTAWSNKLFQRAGFTAKEARWRSQIIFTGWLGHLAEVEALDSNESDAQLRARIDRLIDLAVSPPPSP